MPQRAIVVGANGGIGAATVTRLASAGFEVHAVGRRADIVDSPPAGAARGHVCDVAEPDQIERATREILADGPVKVLVNTAAVISRQNAEECSLDDYERTMAVNVRAPWLFARSVLPAMREQGDGVIINMISTAGITPPKSRFAYSTSKAALRQLTRSIATDYGQYGIRANIICPGPVDTEMWRSMQPADVSDEDYLRLTVQGLAVPRIGTADEVASLVEYLVSDGAAFITGATIAVDGGRTLH